MTLTVSELVILKTPEDTALAKCVGALQFVLAFYVPNQHYLDTEAWKVACARAVDAYLLTAPLIGWTPVPYRADNGVVYEDYTND